MKESNMSEMIKNKEYVKTLKEMKILFTEILIEKLNEKSELELKENNFSSLLDYCIEKLPNEYDTLTYLRNLYFFSKISEQEKLYELGCIYEIMK